VPGSLQVPNRFYASQLLFSLLAVNRRLFEELRTPAGRPLGDFYLLAEQPKQRAASLRKAIRQSWRGWELRLPLGNCDFRLDTHVWSFQLSLGLRAGTPGAFMEPHRDTEFLSGSAMPKIPNGPSRGMRGSANYRRLDFQAVTSSRNLSPDLVTALDDSAALGAFVSTGSLARTKRFVATTN